MITDFPLLADVSNFPPTLACMHQRRLLSCSLALALAASTCMYESLPSRVHGKHRYRFR